MTRSMRDMWGYGQWQAYASQGRSIEEQKARLEEVPESMREVVRDHLNTVYRLKKKAEKEKKRK